MFEKFYDLVVCGGGVAGVAAALAAARRGMKTCLVEKSIQPGGLATGGLVLIYLPLCDGMGTQVTFGLSEELLHASIKYGFDNLSDCWHKHTEPVQEERFRTVFSPASFILAMDELLEAAGVDVWYDTVIVGVERSDRLIEAVNVFNKSGHGTLKAKSFVDATGDSDIAVMADIPCLEAANSLVTWAIEHRDNEDTPGYRFDSNTFIKICQKPLTENDIAPGINGKLVSEVVRTSRKFYLNNLETVWNSGEENPKTRYPLALPGIAPLRHTRCIVGRTTLQPDQENLPCPDPVGLAADWRCCGKVWEIPWSTMLPVDVDNLIAAGRCTSAAGDAWEITRVIPAAAMTGEVAGVAAALAEQCGTVPGKLEYSTLAAELQNGRCFPVKLPEANLKYRE